MQPIVGLERPLMTSQAGGSHDLLPHPLLVSAYQSSHGTSESLDIRLDSSLSPDAQRELGTEHRLLLWASSTGRISPSVPHGHTALIYHRLNPASGHGDIRNPDQPVIL